jgi:hypothetical protein
MIATLIFPEHDYWVGDARIYRVTPSFKGHDYIAVTRHPVVDGQWQNAGVDVVGCNSDGHIPGDYVVALYQSYVVMTHKEVLHELGYSEVR